MLEAQLKGKEEHIKQMQYEVDRFKHLSSSKSLQQFIKVSEESASLVKENNIFKYKLNISNDKINQLESL